MWWSRAYRRAGGEDAGLPQPPPSALRMRRAWWIRSSGPTRAEPTGAPRPFLKQTLTVSKWLAQSAAEMPVATTALKRRAPSRCRAEAGSRRPSRRSRRRVSYGSTRRRPAVVGVLQADEPRAAAQ